MCSKTSLRADLNARVSLRHVQSALNLERKGAGNEIRNLFLEFEKIVSLGQWEMKNFNTQMA